MQKIDIIKNKTKSFFKTDLRYLLKGGIWLSLAQVLTALSSFILAVAFANLLPKETYGTYNYIITLAGILGISTLRMLNTSIAQSVAQGNEGTALAGIGTKIRWGFIGSLGAIFLSCYYFFNDNNTLAILLLIASVTIPFKDSLAVYIPILNGKKDFKRIATFGIAATFCTTLINIVILLVTKNVYYIFLVYSLVGTIINFYLLKKSLSIYKLNKTVDYNSISYGKKISLTSAISSFAGYLDKILIFHFAGAASLAIYTIASAPVSQLGSLFGNINALALPKFSKLDTTQLKDSVYSKETKFFLVTLAVSIFYILISKYLFAVFFPKYNDAIIYTQILAISVPFTVVTRLNVTALQTRFNVRALNNYMFTGSAFQIVFACLGGYFYGLPGIVVSSILTDIFQFVIAKRIFKKLDKSL